MREAPTNYRILQSSLYMGTPYYNIAPAMSDYIIFSMQNKVMQQIKHIHKQIQGNTVQVI